MYGLRDRYPSHGLRKGNVNLDRTREIINILAKEIITKIIFGIRYKNSFLLQLVCTNFYSPFYLSKKKFAQIFNENVGAKKYCQKCVQNLYIICVG